MATSNGDVIATLSTVLAAAGYSLHEGDKDNDEHGFGTHWFCWSDGKTDVEAGDNHPDMEGAYEDALQHMAARLASYKGALDVIASEGTDSEPESDHDDTEGAELHGIALGKWESAEIARAGLRGEFPIVEAVAD